MREKKKTKKIEHLKKVIQGYARQEKQLRQKIEHQQERIKQLDAQNKNLLMQLRDIEVKKRLKPWEDASEWVR